MLFCWKVLADSCYFFAPFASSAAATAPLAAVISASFFFISNSFCIFPPCLINFLVGENSPNLCPTMSSVTKTSTCVLPLCTPKTKPSISGEMTQARFQVLIIGVSSGFLPAILDKSRSSTFSPFLIDLVIKKARSELIFILANMDKNARENLSRNSNGRLVLTETPDSLTQY